MAPGSSSLRLPKLVNRCLEALCCCKCLDSSPVMQEEEEAKLVLDSSPAASPVQAQMANVYGRPANTQARLRQRPSAEELEKGDFQVFVHGSGDCDNLGLGPDDRQRTKPTLVKRLPKWPVRTVACGGLHTIVVFENGQVMSWGSNDHGALGRVCAEALDPTTSPEEQVARMDCEPGFIKLPPHESVRTVSCGDSHTCLLTECGRLYICGTYKDSQGAKGVVGADGCIKESLALPELIPVAGWLGEEKRIVSIASGENHTLALTNDGRVFRWGADATDDPQTPLTGKLWPPQQLSWEGRQDGLQECPTTIFASGLGSFVGLTAANGAARVLAMGLNNFGQLGIGPNDQTKELTEVLGLDSMPLWLGGGTTMTGALMADGRVLVWGHRLKCGGVEPAATKSDTPDDQKTEEQRYQEDLERDLVRVPTELKGLPPISALRCGQGHFLATGKDGCVYGWGDGLCGQLGNAWRDCSQPPSTEEVEESDLGVDELRPYKISSKHLEKRFILLACGSGQHSLELTWRRKATPDGESSDEEGDFDRRRLAHQNQNQDNHDDDAPAVLFINADNDHEFWRVQLEAIYRRRNPLYLTEKLPELLKRYRGNELVLYRKVCTHYDLDPKKLYLNDDAWGPETDVKEDQDEGTKCDGNGSDEADSGDDGSNGDNTNTNSSNNNANNNTNNDGNSNSAGPLPFFVLFGASPAPQTTLNLIPPAEALLPCMPMCGGEGEQSDSDDEDAPRKRCKQSDDKKGKSRVKTGTNLKRSRRDAKGNASGNPRPGKPE